MGMIHYLAARRLSGGQVTALCSRDKTKLAGDWRNIRGNFGPPGEQMDLGNVKRYESLEALLADPDVDLVDICNPTVLHPQTAIAALNAGKHVLVEKAIALTLADADAMLAAAKANGRLLMVAHVLPFFPEFRFAADIVRSGRYGRLTAAHFTRVISKPDWSADIGDATKTGGPAVDLHIHDTHFIGYLCGVPKAVFAVGNTDGDAVNYLTTSYLYGTGGPAVTCSSGAAAAAGRPFVHGFEIYLERATLAFNTGGVPLTVFTADGKASTPELTGSGDPIAAFTLELQAAIDAIRDGREPELLSAKLARDALMLCLKECESVRSGAAVPVGS
jgi:predicted dehydrogenase